MAAARAVKQVINRVFISSLWKPTGSEGRTNPLSREKELDDHYCDQDAGTKSPRMTFPSGTNSAALESPTNRLTTCRVHRQAVLGSKLPPKLVGWTVFFPVGI